MLREDKKLFKKVKKAFTLVELLVVIAILAILSTVSTIGYLSFIEKAKISNDNTLIAQLNTLIELRKVDDDSIDFEDISSIYYEELNEDISNLEPESSKYGYHFWFDKNEGKIILSRSKDLINKTHKLSLKRNFSSSNSIRELLVSNYVFLDGKGSNLANTITMYDQVSSKQAYLDLQDTLSQGNKDKFDSDLIIKLDEIVDNTAFINDEGSFRADDLENTIYVKIYEQLTNTIPSLFSLVDGELVESFIDDNNPIATIDSEIVLPDSIISLSTNSLIFNGENYKIILPDDTSLINNDFHSHFTNGNIIIGEMEFEYLLENDYYIEINNPNGSILHIQESDIAITDFDVYFNDNKVGTFYPTSLDKEKSLTISVNNVKGIPGGSISQDQVILELLDNDNIAAINSNKISLLKYGEVTLRVSTKLDRSYYRDINIQVNGVTNLELEVNDSKLIQNSYDNPFVVEKKKDQNTFNLSLLTSWFVNKQEDLKYLTPEIESTLSFETIDNLNYLFVMEDYNIYEIKVNLPNYNIEKTIYVQVVPEIEHYFDFTLVNYQKFLYRFGNQGTFNPISLLKESDESISANINFEDLDFKVNFYSVDNYGETKLNLLNASSETFYVRYSQDRSLYEFVGEGVVEVEFTCIYKGSEVEKQSLYLEVVNAKNVYSFSDFTSNTNLVLMNDITWSSANNDTRNFTNNFIYGNGFKIDATNIGKMSSPVGLINLSDSTIDNVIVIGKNYPQIVYNGAEDYYSSLINVQTNSSNNLIANCYLSGMRSPIQISGDVVVKNTTVYGGVYSNINIKSGAISVELDNVTTIQEMLTVDNKKVLGAGIYLEQSAAENENTKIIIKNDLKQYNFITKEMLSQIDQAGGFMSDIEKAWKLNENNLKPITHEINSNKYLSSGIAYLGDKKFIYDDSQMNKDNLKYTQVELSALNINGGVISVTHEGENCDNYILNNLLNYQGNYNDNLGYEFISPKISYNFETFDYGTEGLLKFNENNSLLEIGLKYNSSLNINFEDSIQVIKNGKSLVISNFNLYSNGSLISSNASNYQFESSARQYQLEIVVYDVYNYDKNGNLVKEIEYKFYLDINVSVTSFAKPILTSTPVLNENKYDDVGFLFWKDYKPKAAVVKGLLIDDNGSQISFEDCSSEQDLKNKGLNISLVNSPNGAPLNDYKYQDGILYMIASKAWDNKMNQTQIFHYTYISPISGLSLEFDLTFEFYAD